MAIQDHDDTGWRDVDRFRSRADGRSEFVPARFPEGEIRPLPAAVDAFIRMSAGFRSPNVRLVELPADLYQTTHPAPEPQIVVVLRGRIEVTTSDGVTKSWGPGELFIASDHDGEGHHTRVLDGPARLLFVPFDPSVNLDAWTS